MPTRFRGVALAAVLAFVAAPLGAQDYTADRIGMAGALAVGLSSAGLNCTPRCNGDRRAGPTYTVRGAANVTPQFTIAVEGNVFNQSVPLPSGQGRWQLTWVTLGFLWYPRAEEDIFVKAGIGASVMHAHTTFPDVPGLDLNTRDLGFVVGVGRDYRLTGSYGVSVFLDYLTTPRSTGYTHSVDSGARVGADVINAGIALILF